MRRLYSIKCAWNSFNAQFRSWRSKRQHFQLKSRGQIQCGTGGLDSSLDQGERSVKGGGVQFKKIRLETTFVLLWLRRLSVRLNTPSGLRTDRWYYKSIQLYSCQHQKQFIEDQKHRINKRNEFVISSEKTRTQLLNQADCLDRIRHYIRESEVKATPKEVDPEEEELKKKRADKANERRLLEKKRHSLKKSGRGPL